MEVPVGDTRDRIALVDDDLSFRNLVRAELTETHLELVDFPDGSSFLAGIGRKPFDLVLLDLGLPDSNGFDILEKVRRDCPFLPVIVLTATRDIEVVVRCMRAGAFDYLSKPFAPGALLSAVGRARQWGATGCGAGRQRWIAMAEGNGIVGESLAIRQVLHVIQKCASTDIGVLILGESGTGKELIARAIHRSSARREGPFVAINAAAIPETLLESELFGYEKGAFTGAVARRAGKVEEAHGGTLFLDEVAELPLAIQAKLLRVIQEREYQRLGSNLVRRSDFRLLAATHQDLGQAVRAGRFREDLYFRLAVFDLVVPPLRERGEDILLLAQRFIRDFRHKFGSSASGISSHAAELLTDYDWPGNIRELQNAIQRALVLCDGDSILPEHLPAALARNTSRTTAAPNPSTGYLSLNQAAGRSLEDVEKSAIEEAIVRTGGNVTEAMRSLKMGRNRFYGRLHKYDLLDLVEERRQETRQGKSK
jgi:DNA-binding NtrC family response regulator